MSSNTSTSAGDEKVNGDAGGVGKAKVAVTFREDDGTILQELVDGTHLVDMFESLELGLTPKQVFEIDESFFASFDD